MDDNAVSKSGIYKLQWCNGYFYIGQAADLRKRWRSHRYGFKSGHMERHHPKLFNVWSKHGEPTCHVLEYCTIDQLNDAEQRHITQHWGHPLFCNTNPDSRNSRGAKRSKPVWNKGIPMTDERNRLLQEARGDRSGVNHPMCKLDESQVLAIRERYVPYKITAQQLAQEYGVTKQAVLRILNNKTWTHLPSADVGKNKRLVDAEGAIEFNGESRNLRQWAKHLNLNYLTLYLRIKKYGWTLEKAFGDRSHKHGKLTEDQVREIRSKYGFQKKGSGSTALAQAYGVSHKTILGVINGKRYADVT